MGHQSAWQPKHDGLGGGKVRSNKQAQKHWEANTCGRMLEHLLQRNEVSEREASTKTMDTREVGTVGHR